MRAKSPSDNTSTNHLHADSRHTKLLLLMVSAQPSLHPGAEHLTKPSAFPCSLASKKRLNKINTEPPALSELLRKVLEPKETEMRDNYMHRSCKPVQRDHNTNLSALSVSLLPASPAGTLPLHRSGTPHSQKCHLIWQDKDIYIALVEYT